MLITIHPKNPEHRQLQKIVTILKQGGIIIYPTDSVYGFGCDITQSKAVEKICKLKKIDPEKSNLSFICSDLSHLASYTKHIEKDVYRLMKTALPGPYTFIVEASNIIPRLFKNRKKTVGIRVPDNVICKQLVEMLGNPILSSSLTLNKNEDEAYITQPELIYEKYNLQVDAVIDGGIGKTNLSTIIDCSNSQIQIIREGAGSLEEIGIIIS